jgi:hypothetical protein
MRFWRSATAKGAWAFALALACAVPATAAASIPKARPFHVAAAAPSEEARLTAACADLQAQLQKKTDEISALKRGPRGVREDYELRARMAEANELARRLTALENQLSQLHGKPATPSAAPATEGAAALAARADVLSDEARKLAARAAGMARAAGQLRTRQTLHRRAAAVDRDPFAVLDASKRLVITRPAAPLSGGPARQGGSASQESATSGNSAPGTGFAPPATSMPQTTSAGGTPATDKGATTPTQAPTGPTRSELAAGTLIDPALRAELQRLEGPGAAANDPDALERAAAALANRARTLELEAKTLRARAASR